MTTPDYSQRPRGMAQLTSGAMQVRQENAELRNVLADAKRTIERQDRQLEVCAEQIESLFGSLIEAQQYRVLFTELALWSQKAYERLSGLSSLGVSVKPDAVTAELLSSAPAVVNQDPFIADLAANLGVSAAELMRYACESAGVPMEGGE